MTKIRIGIIGAGQNTRKTHIPNLQAIAGVEIIEVANRSLESGKIVAGQFGIPVVKSDWREVATSPDINAVVIGTWPYLHCPATCLALQSGKHVLCEARMAMNLSEAESMLRESWKRPDLVAQLVPSPFTLKVDKTIADWLCGDKLGRLSHLHFEYQSRALSPGGEKNILNWRRNKKYTGSNTMVLGIAYESILRWLGPAEWVSASGDIFNATAFDPETGKDVNVEVPDYLTVQMKMQNGMMGSFLIGETALHAEPPFLNIYGERGALRYRFAVDGDLWFGARDDADKKVVVIPYQDAGRWRVEEEFINAIKGKEKVAYTTFAVGVEYMRFTEAVLQSFYAEGKRIKLY